MNVGGRSFVDCVARYVEREDLLSREDHVLVGVSGGVDSMVCLAVLRELCDTVEALHANYGLRPGADDDEALVRRWCEAQSPPIPLFVVAFDATARADKEGESLQESARILRYDALASRAEERGADVVAVGHHRDDQAETLLLNLLRGAGPEGLAGMPSERSLRDASDTTLIRPLLEMSRREIESFAEAEGIPWREDPSNQDLDYDRVVLRTEILPLLEEHFQGASQNLARAGALMRQYVNETVHPGLEDRMDRCFSTCGDGGVLHLDALESEAEVWQHRLILAALERILPDAPQSTAVAREIQGLIDSQVGRRVELGAGTVWRERGSLTFVSEGKAAARLEAAVPVPFGEDVSVPQGTIRIDLLKDRPDTVETDTPNVEYVDADRLAEPLMLRTWTDGDRIQPLGLDGTKSVADVLTDSRVAPHRRAAVCLLSTDEHPVWIVAHRLDHRVRIRAETENVARLAWEPRENTSDDCNSA